MTRPTCGPDARFACDCSVITGRKCGRETSARECVKVRTPDGGGPMWLAPDCPHAAPIAAGERVS